MKYVFLCLIFYVPGALLAQETILFGDGGKIVYNLQAGTYTVSQQDKAYITDARAVVHNSTTEVASTAYTTRTIERSDINDAFGAGQKIIINLSGAGLPELQQVFYTYAGKPYFLTEVYLRGTAVSSNYMAPLVSAQASIGVAGDNRVLLVPFDNDTFIRYRSRAMSNTLTNVSSEVTAYYDNISRTGLVIGSVEHEDWKTGVRTIGAGGELTELTAWGGYTDKDITRDGITHGTLSGTTVKSPKILVGLFTDWRNGLDEYGKANALAEPRYIFSWDKPTPFGWNSWGAIQDKLNLDNAKAVANFFASSVPAYRSGGTAYVDLDSYWDNMVSGGITGDFSKLKAFADHCKERGLQPGIYWAPFVDWGKSDRTVEGSSYKYSETWTKANGAYHELDGARAMDPTHPATQKRIELLINKFKDCGFTMIKVDFIGHAAIEADSYFDPTVKTGMQAFRKGMEYLVDQLNSKMLIYVAISPNLATGRYAHMRRIACDAYSDIGATEYTLNSTTYGWWQTYVYNYVDADHLVFKSETAGENRARFASGLITGTLITGDDYSTTGPWTSTARQLLQNEELLAIARNGIAFTPVEGNAEQGASETFVRTIGSSQYVAVINYGEKKTYDLSLSRLGIAPGEYVVKELFTGQVTGLQGSNLSREVPRRDAAIFRLTPGTVTGTLTENANDTATLSPNPATDIVKIQSAKTIRTLKVLSAEGKVINEVKNVKSKEYSFSVASFRKGIYIVTLAHTDGTTKVFKVMRD
ncbi:T9SS type A sorting domain-containing protein [Fulvivirgaceae bacterium PWU5]|uniref:T9SS type A sorting domain-containing protein n=1 Tax=Dawidia cretensis TaxID=2782350 RepID=A0AAP2GVX1_9BACT|nr:T9SS type A sorting domain-containing protein [Dawidia cretensis]MBT1711508.1 T9SS type A sorting domain-containing protein [Dawidia cretensis]